MQDRERAALIEILEGELSKVRSGYYDRPWQAIDGVFEALDQFDRKLQETGSPVRVEGIADDH
jgi:hypothetical protein